MAARIGALLSHRSELVVYASLALLHFDSSVLEFKRWAQLVLDQQAAFQQAREGPMKLPSGDHLGTSVTRPWSSCTGPTGALAI